MKRDSFFDYLKGGTGFFTKLPRWLYFIILYAYPLSPIIEGKYDIFDLIFLYPLITIGIAFFYKSWQKKQRE